MVAGRNEAFVFLTATVLTVYLLFTTLTWVRDLCHVVALVSVDFLVTYGDVKKGWAGPDQALRRLNHKMSPELYFILTIFDFSLV